MAGRTPFKGHRQAHKRFTTCIECRRKLPADRYLFCTSECAEESKAKILRKLGVELDAAG